MTPWQPDRLVVGRYKGEGYWLNGFTYSASSIMFRWQMALTEESRDKYDKELDIVVITRLAIERAMGRI